MMFRCKVYLALTSISLAMMAQTANAAFHGRLETSPGSGVYQAFYDDQLDMTWAASANINGLASWNDQLAWAASLDINGVTGWRLPSVDRNGDNNVVDCIHVSKGECLDNEYGHLYFYGAGSVFGAGVTPDSPGPFSNFSNDGLAYWSGTQAINQSAWYMYQSSGSQQFLPVSYPFNAWAVQSGDVSAVPLPASVWLLATGLLALAGKRRNG